MENHTGETRNTSENARDGAGNDYHAALETLLRRPRRGRTGAGFSARRPRQYDMLSAYDEGVRCETLKIRPCIEFVLDPCLGPGRPHKGQEKANLALQGGGGNDSDRESLPRLQKNESPRLRGHHRLRHNGFIIVSN